MRIKAKKFSRIETIFENLTKIVRNQAEFRMLAKDQRREYDANPRQKNSTQFQIPKIHFLNSSRIKEWIIEHFRSSRVTEDQFEVDVLDINDGKNPEKYQLLQNIFGWNKPELFRFEKNGSDGLELNYCFYDADI